MYYRSCFLCSIAEMSLHSIIKELHKQCIGDLHGSLHSMDGWLAYTRLLHAAGPQWCQDGYESGRDLTFVTIFQYI